MKNYKKHISLIILSLVACIPLAIGIYIRHSNTNFSCDSEIIIQNSDETYNIVMHYRFMNGTGKYIATGVIHSKDNTVRPVSRSLTFRYSLDGDSFTLLSNEDINSTDDLKKPDALVPDFFRISGRGVSIRTTRENTRGDLVILGNTPVFYCKRVQS